MTWDRRHDPYASASSFTRVLLDGYAVGSKAQLLWAGWCKVVQVGVGPLMCHNGVKLGVATVQKNSRAVIQMYWIGTSGYDYPEWKGNFYPEGLPSTKTLSYYSERLSTVEINYTFYRMPNDKVVSQWGQNTPERFVFSLKAPRRITHEARLRDCEDALTTFCERARGLGPKLGVILFQLPPWSRKNTPLLKDFLGSIGKDFRTAMEFRHASWFDDEVFAVLKDHRSALCISDTGKETTPLVATADHAYFRLRDEGYDEAGISRWADNIKGYSSDMKDVYIYFKHEEAGKGPEFARILVEKLGQG